jgi:hypothetical protein
MNPASRATDVPFQRLPIQPEDGFPQAFLLRLEQTMYRLALSVSFLTFEPFAMPRAGGETPEHRVPRRSLSLPLSFAGARVQLPWEVVTERDRAIYDLPQEMLYLVLRVERPDLPEGQQIQSVTRTVLGMPIRLGDLEFLFQRIRIARGNLFGPGDFGSEVIAGVRAHA